MKKFEENRFIENYNILKAREKIPFCEDSVRSFNEYVTKNRTPILVCGSGSSYIVAKGIAKIINSLTGIVTLSMTPRDLLYYNTKETNRLIFFSYSGNKSEFFDVIKKKMIDDVVFITCYNKNCVEDYNICIYNEREYNCLKGFNIPESVVVPLIFTYQSLTNKRIQYKYNFWEKCFEKMHFSNLSEIKLCVFSGDFTSVAAHYIKTIFEESAYGCVEVFEKRDYAHGKMASCPSRADERIVYLKSGLETEYESAFYQYISQNFKNIALWESEYIGIEAEIDLIQAVQSFIFILCKNCDMDFGRNILSPCDKNIYQYPKSII